MPQLEHLEQARRGVIVELRRLLYFFLLAAVAGVALVLGYVVDGTRGLLGCGLGVLIGTLISIVSHLLWKRVESSEGHAIVSAVMSAVIVSFVLLVAAIFVVHFLWPEIVKPLTLTALVLYLSHRFVEALGAGVGKGVSKKEPEISSRCDNLAADIPEELPGENR